MSGLKTKMSQGVFNMFVFFDKSTGNLSNFPMSLLENKLLKCGSMVKFGKDELMITSVILFFS